ncbi:hypothetical protein HaLaN_15207, partial [Haematococcus lacustris]
MFVAAFARDEQQQMLSSGAEMGK